MWAGLQRALRFVDPAQPGFSQRLRRAAVLAASLSLVGAGLALVYLSQQPAGRYWTGVSLLELKQYDMCIAQVKPLVDAGADTYGPYRLLATAYRRSGRIAEMNATLDAAVLRFPDDQLALGHRCWYGAIFGRAAEVIDSCERHVALAKGESGSAYFWRGTARLLAGNRTGAAQDLQEALTIWRARQSGNLLYMPAAAVWLEKLQAGENPLDEDTLKDVRGWF